MEKGETEYIVEMGIMTHTFKQTLLKVFVVLHFQNVTKILGSPAREV